MNYSASWMVVVLLLTLSAVVMSRPQGVYSDGQHGAVVGDVLVYSHNVAVSPRNKNKKKDNSKPEKPEKVTEGGPIASRLTSGFELISGTDPKPSSVAVAQGPEISILGTAITFSNPADVIPIAAK